MTKVADGRQIQDVVIVDPNSGNPSAPGGNTLMSFRDAFETFDTATKWTLTKAAGDIVVLDGNTAGASYLTLSLDPLTAGTETRIESLSVTHFPVELTAGLHMSQRSSNQELSLELISEEADGAVYADVALASIQQTTTTLTAVTVTPHGLRIGDRIGFYGVLDSRLNYGSVVVATIVSPLSFTVTAGPDGTLPSLTIGPYLTQGFVYKRSALGYSPNGTSMIFESPTVTNASFYVKCEGGEPTPIGGTLGGSHAVTIDTTASISATGTAAYAYSFRPTSEYRLIAYQEAIQWLGVAVADNTLSQPTSRAKATQVVPSPAIKYRVRFRGVNNKSMTRPIAQIVSATKTGTTTATIVTDVAHGLNVLDYINTYGIRDQTNFPNLTAATVVASIVDANTFTVVIAGAVTATSYGGYVARINGSPLMAAMGASVVTISTAAVANGTLTLVGNATWAWSPGMLINVIGCRADVTGVSMGVDGAYRVKSVVTTVMELEPVGTTVLPADFVAANCGGSTVRRTDLRISYVRVFDFERMRIDAVSRAGADSSSSIPTTVQNTPPVTISSGTVTTVSTVTAVTTAGTPAAPTNYFLNSAASNNGALIITGTVGVQGIFCTNIGATVAFVKLYNKATAPTVGTDVPEMIITVPAAVGGIPGEASPPVGFNGWRFPLGLGIAITGAFTDADTSAVAASQVKVKLSRTA